MKRKTILWAAAGLLTALVWAGEKGPRPIWDILRSAKYKEMALLQGKVKRAFDFDRFLIEDETGQMAVNFRDVRHDFKRGDQIVVYGRFYGRSNYLQLYGAFDAVKWAQATDTEAVATLVDQYGIIPTTATATAATVPGAAAPGKTTETRLKELEDLKAKGLISADEYKAERKRVLDSL